MGENQAKLAQKWDEEGYTVRRTTAHGFPIRAFPVVLDSALDGAVGLIDSMLATCSPDVMARMLKAQNHIGVIGKSQVTTDMPPHSYLKGSRVNDNRDWDSGTRGLGATSDNPCTTCGEENILQDNDRRYPEENVLIHEFGHAVMETGFDRRQMKEIEAAYKEALAAGFDKSKYMFSNDKEFWANGTQAWFRAIIRTDVNEGIITREAVCERLPALAKLFTEVYGENEWSYLDTCPHPEAWVCGKRKKNDKVEDDRG